MTMMTMMEMLTTKFIWRRNRSCLTLRRRPRAVTSSPTSSPPPCWWPSYTSDTTTSAKSLLFCLRAEGGSTHGDPKHQTIRNLIIIDGSSTRPDSSCRIELRPSNTQPRFFFSSCFVW